MAKKVTTQTKAAPALERETPNQGTKRSNGARASSRAGSATWWAAIPTPARSVIIGLLIVTGSAAAGLALLPSARHSAVPAALGDAQLALLGWGAYPLVAALVCGGLVRVVEGLVRRPLMRQSAPLYGVLLWLTLLGWSRTLRGGHTGGLVGGWMANLFNLLPLHLALVLAPLLAIVLACALVGVTWRQVGEFLSRVAALITNSTLRRMPIAADVPALEPPDAKSPKPASDAVATPRRPRRAEAPAPAPTRTVSPAVDFGDDEFLFADPPSASPRRSPAHVAASPARPGPLPFAAGTEPARDWVLPSPGLFEPATPASTLDEDREIEALAERLERTLRALRVDAEVRREDITIGPTVARFGIRPLERKQRDGSGRPELDADGEPLVVRTRVSRILALQPDLALALRVPTLRMEAPVPGQPYVGVEVPNPGARPVGLREVLWSEVARESSRRRGLTIALGRDTAGHPRLGDLTTFPHTLIAGATGSGKSVCLHSILCSLLSTHTPADLRLLLIDPKLVELSIYDGVPHLLLPVITELDAAEEALERAIAEMRRRFSLFSRHGVRNLDSYRRLRERQPELEPLPWLVIVVDEVANLMLAGDGRAEELLCTLAQLARAAGIHLVIATQRPSVDVITGTIKANFPARLAFAMASSADSRTILDSGGAEHLLGRGDMLFVSGERARPERIQGCRVLDDEIEHVVSHWTAQTQPSRRRDRSTSEDYYRSSPSRYTNEPAHLDDDDTIEARQAGGRTKWGWDAPADPKQADEWR